MFLQTVTFRHPTTGDLIDLSAGPSHFSPEIVQPVTSGTVFVKPFHLCSDLQNKQDVSGKIAIIQRGECTFVDKARRAMDAGAKAIIIIDNLADTSIGNQPPFAMSGDGKDDVTIPTCFLFTHEANTLKDALNIKSDLEVSSS
jgi:mannosidase alpha-like ER degradation enhancer 3